MKRVPSTKTSASHVAPFLAVALMALAPNVYCALQNVVVNGYYVSTKDADRRAEIVQTLNTDGDSELPAISLAVKKDASAFERRTAWKQVEDVAIPMPQERVFFSFYVGVPEWNPDKAGRADLTVFIDDLPVFQCELTEPGWHPRLVDLAHWKGKEVKLCVRAGWIEGEPHEMVLALPRIVNCYGPYYAGSGGLGIGPGPHGMPVMQLPRAGDYDEGWSVDVDPSAIAGGALMIARFDCVEPSRFSMCSDSQKYEALLDKGVHWLPLVLGTSTTHIYMGSLSGLVERGPVDIVPNFLAGDEALLQRLTETKAAGE